MFAIKLLDFFLIFLLCLYKVLRIYKKRVTIYFLQFRKYYFYDFKITFVYMAIKIPAILCPNIAMKYFKDKNLIFGHTIWLLHSLLRNYNTKREDFTCSSFVRFIF